jgi:membrane protein
MTGDVSGKHASSRDKQDDPDVPPARRQPAAPSRGHGMSQGAWSTVKELFRRFSQDHCSAFAAALSFYGILAIIPTLVVALAAVAFLLRSPHEALLRLQELVISLLPGSAAQETVQQVLTQASVEKSVATLIHTRGIAFLIGLMSLLWVSLQIFVNAAPAMNAAFAVEEQRGWVKLRLVALGLLTGTGVLFLLSFLSTSGPGFVRRLHFSWLGLSQHVPWSIDAFFALVALAINVSMFALIYKFLPNAPTTWRQVFAGGGLAGMLWELAKKAFAYYLAHFSHYDKVYGTLVGLVILLLWIDYTSLILLLGAEAAALYGDLRAFPPRSIAPRETAWPGAPHPSVAGKFGPSPGAPLPASTPPVDSRPSFFASCPWFPGYSQHCCPHTDDCRQQL